MIDWQDLCSDLQIFESEDPKAIIHEMAHVVDCIGVIDDMVGSQRDVNRMINESYDNDDDADVSEIRVSAMTFMVYGKT